MDDGLVAAIGRPASEPIEAGRDPRGTLTAAGNGRGLAKPYWR